IENDAVIRRNARCDVQLQYRLLERNGGFAIGCRLLIRNLRTRLDGGLLFVAGYDLRLRHHFATPLRFEGGKLHVDQHIRTGVTDGERAGGATDAEVDRQRIGKLHCSGGGASDGGHRAAAFEKLAAIDRVHEFAAPGDAELFLEIRVGDNDTRFDKHLADRYIEQFDDAAELFELLRGFGDEQRIGAIVDDDLTT